MVAPAVVWFSVAFAAAASFFMHGRQRPHSRTSQELAKLVAQSPDSSTDKHEEY
jgi:hypothetical protein